jgi:hypothetical protein
MCCCQCHSYLLAPEYVQQHALCQFEVGLTLKPVTHKQNGRLHNTHSRQVTTKPGQHMREATGCNAFGISGAELLADCHRMPTATTSLLLLIVWKPSQQELAVTAATGFAAS